MADGDYFSVQSKEFEGNLKCFWQELQGENDFCDVTVACEDKQLKTHKVVISKCSPVFRNILKLNQNPHPVIYLKSVKYNDLQNLVTFMYQGEVNVAEADLPRFLELAEDLQIKGLLDGNNDSNLENLAKNYPQDSALSPKRKRVLAKDNPENEKYSNILTKIAKNDETDQSSLATIEFSSSSKTDDEENIVDTILTDDLQCDDDQEVTIQYETLNEKEEKNNDILDNMFTTVFSLENNLHGKDMKEVNDIKKTAYKKENNGVVGYTILPNWLSDLKTNFNTEIISVCSARTKSAVKNNENIKDAREHDRVQNEIINNVMEKLMNILGCEVIPGLKAFRDLAVHISCVYPEMFRNIESSQGRRGVNKIELQARRMSERYNKLRRKEAKNVKI